MKGTKMLASVLVLALAAVVGLVSLSEAAQMGTAFTYQGQLMDAGSPAEGIYDFKFELYDEPDGGIQHGHPLLIDDVGVMGGGFTVGLDFGDDPNVFNGEARWLEMGVRPGEMSGPGDYMILMPRQQLTPTPYAIYAETTGYAEKTSGMVPIGTVIDWWRPDSTWPIPDGFQICDGSTVDDPTSPLNGKALPDLRNKFIMGVTNVNNIGTSSGSSSHSHSVDINHDHVPASSGSTGAHTHTIDVPSYDGTGRTFADGEHNHVWSRFNTSSKIWTTYTSGDGELQMFDWGNGMDSAGTGQYPLTFRHDYVCLPGYECYFYTKMWGLHSHSYSKLHDHAPFTSSSAGPHTHTVNLPALGTQNKNTSGVSNLPPYFGLLKIMRIQ